MLIVLSLPLIVYWFLTLDWYGAEHVSATVLGALATHWRKRNA